MLKKQKLAQQKIALKGFAPQPWREFLEAHNLYYDARLVCWVYDGSPLPKPVQELLDSQTLLDTDAAERVLIKYGAKGEQPAVAPFKGAPYIELLPPPQSEAFQRSVPTYHERYLTAKSSYPDRVILMCVGDFYEAFDTDAEVVSMELDLILRQRKVPRKFAATMSVPMCGFPVDSLKSCIDKLRARGYRLAVINRLSTYNGKHPNYEAALYPPPNVITPDFTPDDTPPASAPALVPRQTPEPPAGGKRATKSPAPRFRKSAEALQKKIDNKRAIRQVNTAKRVREWESAIADALRMERLQDKLDALAEAWETGAVPLWLQGITQKGQVEALLNYDGLPSASTDLGQKLREQGFSENNFLRAREELLAMGNPQAGVESEATKLRRMELQLVGTKIPGFFPTPDAVLDRLMQHVHLNAGDRVLEPSAGKGDIAEYIWAQSPDVDVDVIEWNYSLSEILKAKGFNVIGSDVFEVDDTVQPYDAIVMNPPFEKGADCKHIMFAYDRYLKDGGTLVGVMGNAVKFRQQNPYAEFREWLEKVGGEMFDLPSGSFKDGEINSTGVETVYVVIHKGGAAPKPPADPVPQPDPNVMKGVTWVQHTDGNVGLVKKIDDKGYHVELEQSIDDLREGRTLKGVWAFDDATFKYSSRVRHLFYESQFLTYNGKPLSYRNSRNLWAMGYGVKLEDLRTSILIWAYLRAELAAWVRQRGGAQLPVFLPEDFRHEGKQHRTKRPSPQSPVPKTGHHISRQELDDLVAEGLLGTVGDYYFITEQGCQSINMVYENVESALEATLCGMV